MTDYTIGHAGFAFNPMKATSTDKVSVKWHDPAADAAKLRNIAELVNNPVYRRLHASWIIDKIQEILK